MRPTERVRLCPWANRASWAELCGVPREANAPTGGARESERLQYPEGVGLHGLCGAADGDRAQRACGLVVAAADLTVVDDILGNGVVGRPAGASVRCDGGRGDLPFDDHGGTVTAVAPAVDALGSVNVDLTSLRIAHFVEVHRLGVQLGGLGLKRLHVTTAQLWQRAALPAAGRRLRASA